MEENIVTIRQSLDEVLSINAKISNRTKREKLEKALVEDLKLHCKNLTDRGIYKFDTSNDSKLVEQVRRFASYKYE